MNKEIVSNVSPNNETQVRSIYNSLLQSWNNHNAREFAALFIADGNTIGFDGSQMNGRQEIENQLEQIFHDHKVASYVGVVKEVRQLSPTIYLLRSVAGMIPPGQKKIKQDVNAIQTLILQKDNDDSHFLITLFQNTPAAFHGRPELSAQLTEELQQAADHGGNGNHK